MTDYPASYDEAMAVLQTRLPDIPKASKAQYGAYANLTDVSKKLLPVLGELGLSFTARPTWVQRDDGTREFVLAYKLRHVSGTGEEGEYPLVSADKAVNHQTLGGAITYGRRYCLCAITGAVADDDDDGQAAATGGPATGRQPRAKPPQRAAAALPANRDGSTSRSQVTDAELADTGQMTGAQQRDHNRLERDVKGTGPQGTERLTTTPDDDPWYKPIRVPAPHPATSGVIHQYFKNYGYTDSPEDRTARLKRISAITGRAVTSVNELTASEGLAVVRFLEKCKDLTALDEQLAAKAGEDIG